ncbi:hypothetical protein [Siminovitchia fortis]|nr:hypothetical protein [Siminovitchia fortis]
MEVEEGLRNYLEVVRMVGENLFGRGIRLFDDGVDLVVYLKRDGM